MQYLTYEEYTEIGGTLEETAFARHLYRACAFVDLYTQNRLESKKTVSQKVKACVRDLIEYLAENYSGKAVASKSQSAGGVSESVSYATKTTDEMSADMLCIVYDYLATEKDDYGTPLMYRGAMR